MKKVLKADRESFSKTITDYLISLNAKIGETCIGKEYSISTKCGELKISDPYHWNEHGSSCLSLMTRFTEDKGKLPSDANPYSGKWNFHLTCNKGEGVSRAETIKSSIGEWL